MILTGPMHKSNGPNQILINEWMLGFKLLKKFRDKEETSKHHTSYETTNKASPLMEKMKKKMNNNNSWIESKLSNNDS